MPAVAGSKPAVVRQAGITDGMVAAQKIKVERLREVAAAAALVVALHATLDHPWTERRCDVFTTRVWACSMFEVDWRVEGYAGNRLSYLATGSGYFYEGHRAVTDCAASIELL